MKNFFVSDSKVLTENKIDPQDYRIYEYFCSNFNIKKVSAYIRIVDAAGHFALSQNQIKESLSRLSQIVIDGSPLVTIEDGPNYLIFDMPRYKRFLETIGFRKHNASVGWKNLGNYIRQSRPEAKKNYLYPKLDQHQLDDKLRTLNDEQFSKLNQTQFQYPWVFKNEKKRRTAPSNR